MDFMIDLETFGTTASAPVFAIGCIPVRKPTEDGFYTLVQPDGFAEFDTIAWWLEQAGGNPEASKQAVQAIREGADYTASMLDMFDYMRRKWAMSYDGQNVDPKDRKPIRVWSKGSIFDIAIIRRAAEKRGLDIPWSYQHEMCFRTVEALCGNGVTNPPDGLAHHALEDARWQAYKLNNIIEAHGENLHFKF